jgi:glutathione synthase/RimK-type ligase-like ATP-grasp enzyme
LALDEAEPLREEDPYTDRIVVIEDGMFLVGLDIVGDKLMEISVFSPGGLGSWAAI